MDSLHAFHPKRVAAPFLCFCSPHDDSNDCRYGRGSGRRWPDQRTASSTPPLLHTDRPAQHPPSNARQVRKFDHPEEDRLKCLLPLHTSELGRLSIPESERESDPIEDGGPGDTRTEEEAVEEYKTFMDEHGVAVKVGFWTWVGLACCFGLLACWHGTQWGRASSGIFCGVVLKRVRRPCWILHEQEL